MKISQAISLLLKQYEKHGDIEVFADCEACGHETKLGVVALVEKQIVPEKAMLSGKRKVSEVAK